MKRIFNEFTRKVQQSPPYPFWRRYDCVFCNGPIELQNALHQINVEGHVIVSITQDLTKYTIIFKRFD